MDLILIQCTLATPNFRGALRSAANCLVRAVAKLCRLAIKKGAVSGTKDHFINQNLNLTRHS